MNPETLQALRGQLLRMREDLLERVRAQRGGTKSRVEAAAEHFEPDSVDDSPAQRETERETEFALEEHELAELSAIDAALARMDRGEYGMCIDCGVEIPAARLQAAPETPRCVACQEAYERRHGTRA
jgi:DnaK suppressor protein